MGRIPVVVYRPDLSSPQETSRGGRAGTSVGSPVISRSRSDILALNEGDQPQAPTAPRTREDVKPETAAHQVGPWLSAPSSAVVPPCGTT